MQEQLFIGNPPSWKEVGVPTLRKITSENDVHFETFVEVEMHIVHWNGGVRAFDERQLTFNAVVDDAIYP